MIASSFDNISLSLSIVQRYVLDFNLPYKLFYFIGCHCMFICNVTKKGNSKDSHLPAAKVKTS